MVGGAQQNRATPSSFDFGLWTLDLDLDCDNINLLPGLIVSTNGVQI